MKIVKSLKELGLLIKKINKIIKNEAKEKKKGEFTGMLLVTLAASLLGSAWIGQGVIKGREGTSRTGQNV